MERAGYLRHLAQVTYGAKVNGGIGSNKLPEFTGVGLIVLLARLLDHSFIIVVSADPNPNEVSTIFNCKRPVIEPSPN